MINLDNLQSNGSVAFNVFPLVYWQEALKDMLNIQLAYYNVAEGVGQLGTLTDDFYRYGSTLYYQTLGKFSPKSRLSWQIRYWDSDEPRFNFALHYKQELTL